jgi:hypothetical protein
MGEEEAAGKDVGKEGQWARKRPWARTWWVKAK